MVVLEGSISHRVFRHRLSPVNRFTHDAIVLGLATPEMVFHEAEVNFPVIMLLMFMVAGIYFLREMLLFVFTKILLGVRSKVLLSLLFSFTAAFLSAFLDALTVTAVIITVAVGFFGVYHKVASGKKVDQEDHDQRTEYSHSGISFGWACTLAFLSVC